MSTPNDTSPTKHCHKCNRDLPATPEFWHRTKNKRGEPSLASQCKDCCRARAKKWADDNPERNRKRARDWYWDDPERARASAKQWHDNNPDKVKAYRESIKETRKAKRKSHDRTYRQRKSKSLLTYNRQYRDSHPEIYRKATDNWRKRNPEKAKAMMHQRIAARKGAPGSYTEDDLRRQLELQDGRCAYCGITLHGSYHVDHVIPISRGGTNGPDNIVGACDLCNLGKGARTVAEWQAVRGW